MSVYWMNNGNNLTVSTVSTNTAKATVGRTTGKYYWEIYINRDIGALVGIVNSSVTLTTSNFANTSCRWYYYLGAKTPPRVNYGSSFTTGDTIGVLLDLDNNRLEFFKNGVSQGVAFADLSSLGEVYPAVSSGASSGTQTVTANFGASNFTYIPSSLPVGTLSYDGSQRLKNLNKTLILHDGEHKKFIPRISESMNSLIPKMTSATSPSGIASSSNNQDTTYVEWKAFDKVLNVETSSWVSTVIPAWVAYEFPTRTIVNYYQITRYYNGSNARTFDPVDWTFEAWDGSNWIVLDSRSGESFAEESKTFYFENNNDYIKYRVNITKVNGASKIAIAELDMGIKTNFSPSEWLTMSSTLPTQDQFLTEGMDSLSPLLDRRIEALEPQSMTDKSEILNGEEGKVFTGKIDLKKYIDVKSIKVEVE